MIVGQLIETSNVSFYAKCIFNVSFTSECVICCRFCIIFILALSGVHISNHYTDPGEYDQMCHSSIFHLAGASCREATWMIDFSVQGQKYDVVMTWKRCPHYWLFVRETTRQQKSNNSMVVNLYIFVENQCSWRLFATSWSSCDVTVISTGWGTENSPW